jgi:predicted nuclease with TOPRIM domain
MGSNASREIMKQQNNLQMQIKQLKCEFAEQQDNNKSKRSEIEEINTRYEELEIAHSKLIEERNKLLESSLQVQKVKSKISETVVDDYVETILSDPNVQHGYFTEAIEGIVYRRALKAILQAVAKSLDSAQVNFMGHKISFSIEPIENKSSSMESVENINM